MHTPAKPLSVLPSRRDLLRLGVVALGSLGGEAAGATTVKRGWARACILLYMDGGPSHIDLWDLKPGAPAEVRGPYRPIASSLPGVTVSELLPRTARCLHLVTQVRTVQHRETVHDPAVYQMLTGVKHPISAGGLTVQGDDHPHLASAFARVDAQRAVFPRCIELPETMKMEARILPGQNAGVLGRSFDPFRVEVTPEGHVVPPPFARHGQVSAQRLESRGALLERVRGLAGSLEREADAGRLDLYQRQALDLLRQRGMTEAFDLEREPATLRERYGRHRHGQSVLLARRLVEAGARFVTVYWGAEPQDWADGRGPRPANNPWDTHRNHFPLLKESLAPRADQTLSALLLDLEQRGLLDETLVVWMGDFGRTPRINRQFASRDHWPGANTVLLAGAGIPRGAVVGRTDSLAAEPVDAPVSPADLTATILAQLGIRHRQVLTPPRGPAFPLSTGTPLFV
ncbi:MAG: DUF1501 domain-containing protein [Gemmataceae bacterium]